MSSRGLMILLSLLLTALSVPVAQAQLLGEQPKDSVWVTRVKLLQQFINRFNYSEDWRGDPVTEAGTLNERRKYIASLFDADYTASVPREQLLTFVEDVTGSFPPEHLSFYDDNWYAQVNCKASYLGKETEVMLTLKVQQNDDRSVQWVVVGGFAEFLKLEKNDQALVLNGNANELNFMRLFIGLDEKQRIADFTADDYEPDPLSIILFLVQKGDLELKHAQSISYHFYQLPGWIFSVKEFDRHDYNSGWLIYRLDEADEEKKKALLAQRLFVHE